MSRLRLARGAAIFSAGLVSLSISRGLSVAARAAPPEAPPAGGHEIETGEADLIRRLADRLSSDAAAREAVARRIARSSLAHDSADARDASVAEIASWVEEHPREAAGLAVGFAADDRNGSHSFEDTLRARLPRDYELNPNRYGGILGLLARAGAQSDAVRRQVLKLGEEEQSELLKRVFEGTGSGASRAAKTPGSGRASTETGDGKGGAAGGAAVAAKPLDIGIYDRLRAGNLSGYSPEVLAFQSALNAERVPGMPKLLETGRLDYQTLIYPCRLLRFDLGRLQKEMARSETWASTKADSGASSAERLSKRRLFLSRAEQSVAAIESEAEKTRDPRRVTQAALRRLGEKQRESARWITAASLEADLERWDGLDNFLTEDLKRRIFEAPAPEPTRRAYWDRGLELRDRLEKVKKGDAGAIAILEGPDYLKRWGEVQRLVSAAAALRANLDRALSLYTVLPFQLADLGRPKSGLKRWLDRCARRLSPDSAYVRRLDREESRLRTLQDAFQAVAAGRFPSFVGIR